MKKGYNADEQWTDCDVNGNESLNESIIYRSSDKLHIIKASDTRSSLSELDKLGLNNELITFVPKLKMSYSVKPYYKDR